MIQYESALLAAMKAVGLDFPGPFQVDSALHRFGCSDDDAGDKPGWYVLHAHDSAVAGAFGDWKRLGSKSIPFWSVDRSTLSPADQASLQEAIKQAQSVKAAAEKESQTAVRLHCAQIFGHSQRLTDHPYAVRKRFKLYGRPILSQESRYPNWLQVPLQDDQGVIHSAQLIAEDSTKRFLYEGRTQGCFIAIPGPPEHPLIICEGYATGCSIHQATGWEVACAGYCGNLPSVTLSLRKKFPDRTLIIAADNDQFNKDEHNPGIEHAQAAAKSTRAFVSIPQFADEALADKPTDFNDLSSLSGPAEVERQIVSSLPKNNFYRARIDRAFNILIVPPPLQPVYTLANCVVSTPGNISMISSQVKMGKSSVVGAALSSALSKNPNPDFLSFSSENPDGKAILHFDTEQSPDDHNSMVRKFLARANLSKPPEWFHSFSLAGMSWSDAWDFVRHSIPFYSSLHHGCHSVAIDGIGDLVPSVNDEINCNARVSEVFDLASCYYCAILSVLHFNPGTEKTRGHLGSQLERKSETNLKLEQNCTGIMIWSEKQRRAPIRKENAIKFQWSDDYQMHILSTDSCTDVSKPKVKPGPTTTVKDQEILMLIKPTWAEWLKACRAAKLIPPASDSSFDNALKRLQKANLASKDPMSGNWRPHSPPSITP